MTALHDAMNGTKQNLPRWLAGVLGCFVLASCGTVMMKDQPQSPPPDTKVIVLRYLRKEPSPAKPGNADPGPGNLFANVQKLGAIELSPPSLVQHPTLGWTWLACLRTHPADGPAGDYALFIGDDRIRDARLSVATDGCATQSYEALGRFTEPAKKTNGALRRRTGSQQ